MKLPDTAPVLTQYLADFTASSGNLLAQLTNVGDTRLAGSAGASSGAQTAAH